MAPTPTEQQDIFAALRARAVSALAEMLPDLPPDAFARVQVEPPRDPAHGDMATNAALVVAKPARQPPPKLAAALAERLAALPEIESAAPAGPMSNTSPPTPPALCMSAIAAARWWAMRWPTSSPRPAGR